jgi:hypothetical protein
VWIVRACVVHGVERVKQTFCGMHANKRVFLFCMQNKRFDTLVTCRYSTGTRSSKDKLSDSTWSKLTGQSEESLRMMDSIAEACMGDKRAASAQDGTHATGKHASKDHSKSELDMSAHRKGILECLLKFSPQTDGGYSQRWDSTSVAPIVKHGHRVATEIYNLQQEEKPRPPASIDVERLKRITALLHEISGIEVSQAQSDLEIRRLDERKTKIAAELKQKVLARDTAREEAKTQQEVVETSLQNNPVQLERQQALEARIALEARVAECRRDAALARDMVQLTAHIIQLHTGEMRTYSADKEKRMLAIIDSITQATDKLLYHEKFIASGILHEATPAGAVHALMGMKRWVWCVEDVAHHKLLPFS